MTVCPLPSVGVPTESGRLPIEKNDDQSFFFFVFLWAYSSVYDYDLIEATIQNATRFSHSLRHTE